ncbi:amidohydrolase family protein [Chitinophaga barathri]|uniref:Amidohydrolase-related domain-containing protein n=1 Tax=Chitinophaga barathri TaxID=1647451 RepID=A0A3N4MKN1_9BACT|nr:amidohydrolase family protein [Chitinophaga barathri]RPD42497.1 hypothetical protein EG028_04800 [Chitinophaga barathri]
MRTLLLLLTLSLPSLAWSQTTIIRDVNVVDVRNGKILRNQTVVLNNKRITSIGKRSVKADSATVIDGSGKYLIPGLWDMHVHNFAREGNNPLLIANGITGVRDMFGSITALRQWNEEAENGKYPGPVIHASGPIVDGPKPVWPGSVAVSTPEQGIRAVDSLVALKVDFIKVYSLLDKASYLAIAAEAKKQNIPFAGHVPNRVTALEAAAAGQKSMEHMYGITELGLDSLDYYMAWQQGAAKDTLLNNRNNRNAFRNRNFSMTTFSKRLAELAKYDSWQCPTLVVNRGIAYMNDSTFTKDPRLAYMHKMFRNMWDPAKDFRFKTATPETFAQYRRDYELKMSLIKPMHDAGIRFIAGTDFPNPYCFPGFSLHDELGLFVKAGLTPLQSLQTATLNPAVYMAIEKDYGAVEAGKYADLLLLNANPLADIVNTKDIFMVFLHGKVYDKTAIDNLLASIRKMNAN